MTTSLLKCEEQECFTFHLWLLGKKRISKDYTIINFNVNYHSLTLYQWDNINCMVLEKIEVEEQKLREALINR